MKHLHLYPAPVHRNRPAGKENNLRGSLQDISQGENYSFKDEQTLLALLHSLVQIEGASQGEVEKRAKSS